MSNSRLPLLVLSSLAVYLDAQITHIARLNTSGRLVTL